MIAVTIPTTDVNSESAVVVRWYVDDRSTVAPDDALVEIETSKAILDVSAPGDGILLRAREQGEQLRIDEPLGYLFETADELERHLQERAAAAAAPPEEHEGRITTPARRRAQELGVDIDAVARDTEGLVTSKMVDAFAASADAAGGVELPEPLKAEPGVRRLVIIGAGLGATQVLDILTHDEAQTAVALVDDSRERWGEAVGGVPVVGGFAHAVELFTAGGFDAAIIAISTSVPARTRLRELCRDAGIPLANAIDPTARICQDVRMGQGNVICANCHLGVATVLGDNNFLSAYNSFDHHNELGSDISTGPGCMTSGLVKLQDRCRLGTGIFIEPYVTIGAGSLVASGAVIVGSVPPDHVVKTRIVTTSVVPIRRG
ncbi:MAG: biotin/lipoyl-containing protein [Solirubrobacteraceae bacterium]